MFKNYLTTAIRNLLSNRLYSAINIFGLAIGLASCILILLFVLDELSYDRFWSNADNTYRVHIRFEPPGRDPFVSVVAPGPLKAALPEFFGEIETSARIFQRNPTVRVGDRFFIEPVSYADHEFLDIFEFDVISGDIEAAINSTRSMIMTEKTATKYFGRIDVIGETLTVAGGRQTFDYTVGAVIRDLPDNTHMAIGMLAGINPKDWEENSSILDQWFSVNTATYIKMAPGTDIAQINASLPDFINANWPAMPVGDKDAQPSDFVKLSMMNIADIQLHAEGFGEMKATGDITTVYIFSAIAFLILVIASINFMNLATAKSTQRAREVSLRKVVGASRRQIIIQFLGESIILTLISLIVALGTVELVLPWYGAFVDKKLTLDIIGNSPLILTFVALAAFVGLIGGLYPAVYLSRFRPADILKANRSSETVGSARLRTALVVLQFAISICFVSSTAIVYGQTIYARNMDPGFNKDNILVLRGFSRDGARQHQQTVMAEIERLPGVTTVTRSSDVPSDFNENNTMVRLPGVPNAEPILIGNRNMDTDFFKAYQVELIAGRHLEKGRVMDEVPLQVDIDARTRLDANIIVNEAAVGRLGLGTPEEAIGQVLLYLMGSPDSEEPDLNVTIVGVMANIHFQSIHRSIRPELYFYDTEGGGRFNVLSIRHDGRNLTELVDSVEGIWTSLIPDVPFQHEFLDESMAALYNAEEQRAEMLAAFALLAVIVACLGLYGLASFTAERRTKEIGIRKVMGASVADIIKLLIWQFSRPVIMANFIAWPAAWFLMTDWLSSFQYRIDLVTYGPLIFLGASLAALLIAWATVAFHAGRVARSNPITALRYE